MTYPFKLKKGTFKHYLHGKYGKKAFKADGKIKMTYVNKVLKNKKVSAHRHKQAQFVKNASKFKHR